MYLEHIAMWTSNLEVMKSFYETYFDAHCGPLYHNPKRRFYSYFLTFDHGARLELMSIPELESPESPETIRTGYAHMAIAATSNEEVDAVTARLKADGYKVVGEPRWTGDGYYESVIQDPDGNLVEITAGSE